ncbi:glutathione S-transferase [Mycena rebaudengoi]|nr:glutathione S-transferase [Mycena rebaudengoi]
MFIKGLSIFLSNLHLQFSSRPFILTKLTDMSENASHEAIPATSTSPINSSEVPKITLHWLERSRSQRILWLLEEARVPYEIKTYKRDPATSLAPPELLKIHPLGKSPVITVGDEVIAESGPIVEYLSDHFGTSLIPTKWKEGREGKVGGETAEFMRYRYYLHYTEGSLMSLMVLSIVPGRIKSSPVPFFIRPITSRIAAGLYDYINPELRKHFAFMEEQLATAPGGGPYLCGAKLTSADILMSFPLTAAQGRSPLNKEAFPKLWAYTELLKQSEGYKRAAAKIVEVVGKFDEGF